VGHSPLDRPECFGRPSHGNVGGMPASRLLFHLILIASLLAAAVAPASAGAVTATPTRPIPPAWTAVSEAGADIRSTPSVARTSNGLLHVVWHSSDGATSSLRHRTRTNAGVWSATTVITSGWNTLTNPAIFLVGSTPYVTWADTAGALIGRAGGRAWVAWLAEGAWKVSPEPVTTAATLAGARGLAAATRSDGSPVIAWADVAGMLHANLGFAGPAAEPDLGTTCCVAAPNLARDAKTGAIHAVYASTLAGDRGIYARQLTPSLGAPTRLPGAGTRTASTQRTTRLAAASRLGAGGVYTAYCDRAPRCTRIRVAGTDGRSLTTATKLSANPESVGVASSTGGRLWVYWSDARNAWAQRSNAAFSAWGEPVPLALPPRTSASAWFATGEGTRGSLELIANVSRASTTRLWHRRADPGLTVTATPTSLPAGRLQIARFTITDAGMRVRGKVTFGGVTHTTNSSGVATFLVSSNRPAGRYVVTGTALRYSAGTTTFRLG
ncbi:MAG: hypothetical protein JWO69_171, partial [Thermoleophilia bacterium]|nr:hypothetical protein [Thermoleophilia bacterium]